MLRPWARNALECGSLLPLFSRELARAPQVRFVFEATAGKPAPAKAAASCRIPKRLRRRTAAEVLPASHPVG